jgi:hypothetical protein
MARKSKKLLRKKSTKRGKLNNVRLGKKGTRKRKPWKKRTMRGGMDSLNFVGNGGAMSTEYPWYMDIPNDVDNKKRAKIVKHALHNESVGTFLVISYPPPSDKPDPGGKEEIRGFYFTYLLSVVCKYNKIKQFLIFYNNFWTPGGWIKYINFENIESDIKNIDTDKENFFEIKTNLKFKKDKSLSGKIESINKIVEYLIKKSKGNIFSQSWMFSTSIPHKFTRFVEPTPNYEELIQKIENKNKEKQINKETIEKAAKEYKDGQYWVENEKSEEEMEKIKNDPFYLKNGITYPNTVTMVIADNTRRISLYYDSKKEEPFTYYDTKEMFKNFKTFEELIEAIINKFMDRALIEAKKYNGGEYFGEANKDKPFYFIKNPNKSVNYGKGIIIKKKIDGDKEIEIPVYYDTVGFTFRDNYLDCIEFTFGDLILMILDGKCLKRRQNNI